MAWDQTADLEEGDTSDFDNVVQNGSSTITATEASACNGSYGCEVSIDASHNTTYGVLSDPAAETEFTAEFQLYHNNLTMGDPNAFAIFAARVNGSTAVRVSLVKLSGTYRISLDWWNDAAGATSSSNYTIGLAWYKIRVYWKAATGAAANDGIIKLFINDVQRYSIINADTDTLSIANAVYGAWTGIDAGTVGIFYMDDCRWNNEPSSFSTPDVARAIPQVVVPTVRIREIVANSVRAISQVDPGTTRIREIVANVTRAIGQVSVGASWVSKALRALFRNYTLIAPEHIEIESNAGIVVAPFRDYELIADKRKTDA